MSHIVTIGEPMVMFVADEVGALEDINHYSKYVAGAELNVSIGLSRLGHEVTYVTRLGRDPFGRYIHNVLQANRLDTTSAAYDDDFSTGFQLKSKVTTGDPEVVYFRANSAASHLSVKDITEIDLSSVHHVHVTGIPLALSETAREATWLLIQRAKEEGLRVSFDPNLRPSLWPNQEFMIDVINETAVQCDLILPGIEEGRLLTGRQGEEGIAAFYRDLGVPAVAIKLGAEGAYACSEDESSHVEGFQVNHVVDTVGAGDGFAVGVINALLEGLSLSEAVRWGNAIGALQVMVPGDNEGLPNRDKLRDFLAGNFAG